MSRYFAVFYLPAEDKISYYLYSTFNASCIAFTIFSSSEVYFNSSSPHGAWEWNLSKHFAKHGSQIDIFPGSNSTHF